MPEIYSRFVYGLYGFVAVAILLIIFDKQLKDLEDRFDEWYKQRKKRVISRKKLKALMDENEALRKENVSLMDDNERLSDSNLDLYWDNKILNVRLQKKEGQKFGTYFYEAAKRVAHPELQSE